MSCMDKIKVLRSVSRTKYATFDAVLGCMCIATRKLKKQTGEFKILMYYYYYQKFKAFILRYTITKSARKEWSYSYTCDEEIYRLATLELDTQNFYVFLNEKLFHWLSLWIHSAKSRHMCRIQMTKVNRFVAFNLKINLN